MAMELRNDNFKKEVLESKIPVLVDFWEIAKELKDAKVGKVNVDEQSELAAEYRIMSIPTLMVFKDGAVVKKAVGAVSKAEILNLLK